MGVKHQSNPFSKKIDIDCDQTTQILVLSDIHLAIEETKRDQVEEYLCEQITKLSKAKHAMLVLNGDVFELWRYPNIKLQEVIDYYPSLKMALQTFNKATAHRVYYLVGNHDIRIAQNVDDQNTLVTDLKAALCLELNLHYQKKVLHFEHGHQFDPYNRFEDPFDSNQHPKGEKIVHTTLPLVHKILPRISNGIDDVIDRLTIPTFAISRFFYRLFLTFGLPIMALSGVVAAIAYGQATFVVVAIISIVTIWVLSVLMSWMLPIISRLVFGSMGDVNETQIDEILKDKGCHALVIGHTHRGMLLKTKSGLFANSGCNDMVQIKVSSGLGVPLYQHFSQNSSLWFELTNKVKVTYNQQRRPIMDETRLEKFWVTKKDNEVFSQEVEL